MFILEYIKDKVLSTNSGVFCDNHKFLKLQSFLQIILLNKNVFRKMNVQFFSNVFSRNCLAMKYIQFKYVLTVICREKKLFVANQKELKVRVNGKSQR